MPVGEAVEALDRSVMELYDLNTAESETVGDVAVRVEKQAEALDDLRDGVEELAGYFQRFIEEAGGEVEYEHVEPNEGDGVAAALEGVEVEEFA